MSPIYLDFWRFKTGFKRNQSNSARYLVHKRHSKKDHEVSMKRGAKFDIDFDAEFKYKHPEIEDDDEEDPDEDCDEDHTTDLPTASGLTSPAPTGMSPSLYTI